MTRPLCTIITATTGNPILRKCIESVMNQTHRPVQHLLFIDGPNHSHKVYDTVDNIDWRNKDWLSGIGRPGDKGAEGYDLNVIDLPYATGTNRWNGHRMYAAGTFLAEGDYVMFLDDDNFLEPTHIEDCLKVIEAGNDWAYSLRNLVSPDGTSLGQDNCESLGKWASVLHPDDYFIDVNCYFMKRLVAVAMAPVWYRQFRTPGQMEIDRAMIRVLTQQISNKYDCTYKYTVNYTVGNSPLSVQPDFFKQGNAEMLRRYNGVLPWQK